MEELNQEALDSALILENKLKERVERIVHVVVVNMIGKEIHAALEREKQAMMMEIAITVGKIMKNTAEEHRRPLWESTPEEFGLDNEALNTHNLGSLLPPEDRRIEGTPHALQEPSRPQI